MWTWLYQGSWVSVYESISKSSRTESIMKCTLITINTHWEVTQRVMVAKSHYTDSQNSDTTAPSGRELYHLQFSLQAASPETFGYTLVLTWTFHGFLPIVSMFQFLTLLVLLWSPCFMLEDTTILYSHSYPSFGFSFSTSMVTTWNNPLPPPPPPPALKKSALNPDVCNRKTYCLHDKFPKILTGFQWIC
jgi:hypothetical protein